MWLQSGLGPLLRPLPERSKAFRRSTIALKWLLIAHKISFLLFSKIPLKPMKHCYFCIFWDLELLNIGALESSRELWKAMGALECLRMRLRGATLPHPRRTEGRVIDWRWGVPLSMDAHPQWRGKVRLKLKLRCKLKLKVFKSSSKA